MFELLTMLAMLEALERETMLAQATPLERVQYWEKQIQKYNAKIDGLRWYAFYDRKRYLKILREATDRLIKEAYSVLPKGNVIPLAREKK